MTNTSDIPRQQALAVLGLSSEASAREITRAYHRLARRIHPDVAEVSDRDAGQQFTALTAAYQALTPVSSTSGPAPPPPAPTPAGSTPFRRSVAIGVRFTPTPFIAGPVRITPSPSTSRRSP